MKNLSILALVIAIITANVANAQGLAMHGTPKYDENANSLDYVNKDAPKGGTLRQAGIGSFDSLNPFALKGKPADGLSLVFDRLMARVWDEPFTLYPLVAETVTMPDDRSSMTITINPKAQFHDGSPILADDIIFSYETLKTSGRPNMRRIYALATQATKNDDRSVTFTFGDGFDRETAMIFAMMPVLSKAYWEDKIFDQSTLTAPLTSGPYKIAKVDPGRKITYERVKDYWGADLFVNRGQNNFDTVIYDYFRDDLVALEAFKAGGLDMRRENDPSRWASSYDFPAVKNGTIRLESLPHGRAERVKSLIFNTRRAPFDDLKVRKALSFALDFDWINKNLYHGQYQRISSYFPNTQLAAIDDLSARENGLLTPYKDSLPAEVFGTAWRPPRSNSEADYRQNLRIADQLLNEAGWVIKDGKRVNADGKQMSFEITISAPEDEKIALAFQRGLKRLGVQAPVRLLDQTSYIGRLQNYDYDMTLYHWQNTLSPGTEQVLYWSCEAAKQPARFNYSGICNPAIDHLAQSIANAKDYAELVAMTRALDRALTWGYYAIPLFYSGKDNVALRNNISHPPHPPIYGIVTETWWDNNNN
jgi:microcin C transport system substrate-binding protein